MPSNMPEARAINEGLRRAREMQNRSASQPKPESAVSPLPAEPETTATPQQNPPQSIQQQTVKTGAPLDFLLQDKERTLILVLLLLLSSEPNNTELLFVLMYLLI